MRPGSSPQALRIADSSAALAAFLKRAPDWPFTRRSHSAHVSCRIGTPPTTLKYEYAAVLTAGRAAAIFLAAALFGVGIQGGSQLGFASLVDLKTGNVVWFNRLARASGDLRTEAPAEETVKTLLTSFPK